MSTPMLQPQEVLGLFELDETGRVLYSSMEGEDGSLARERNIKGLHFFSQVVAFANAEELRRRFEIFKCESITASSFDFICHYANTAVPVRVLLARLREQESLLLHLRKNSNGSNSSIA